MSTQTVIAGRGRGWGSRWETWRTTLPARYLSIAGRPKTMRNRRNRQTQKNNFNNFNNNIPGITKELLGKYSSDC